MPSDDLRKWAERVCEWLDRLTIICDYHASGGGLGEQNWTTRAVKCRDLAAEGRAALAKQQESPS